MIIDRCQRGAFSATSPPPAFANASRFGHAVFAEMTGWSYVSDGEFFGGFRAEWDFGKCVESVGWYSDWVYVVSDLWEDDG